MQNSLLMNSKQKGGGTTFYKLLQEGGYIKDSFDITKERQRPWHVKRASEVELNDSD